MEGQGLNYDIIYWQDDIDKTSHDGLVVELEGNWGWLVLVMLRSDFTYYSG